MPLELSTTVRAHSRDPFLHGALVLHLHLFCKILQKKIMFAKRSGRNPRTKLKWRGAGGEKLGDPTDSVPVPPPPIANVYVGPLWQLFFIRQGLRARHSNRGPRSPKGAPPMQGPSQISLPHSKIGQNYSDHQNGGFYHQIECIRCQLS